MTIEQVQVSLNYFKMEYYNKTSIYYNALSAKVRNEMTIDKCVLLQPSLLLTKEDQLQSMNICRAWVVKALHKIVLVKQSVQSLISK